MAITLPLMEPVCWAKSGVAEATRERSSSERRMRPDTDAILTSTSLLGTTVLPKGNGARGAARREAGTEAGILS